MDLTILMMNMAVNLFTDIFTNYKLLQPAWLWFIIPLIAFLLIQPWLIKKQWLKQNHSLNLIAVKHPFAHQNSDHSDSLFQSRRKTSLQLFFTTLSSSLILLALAQPVKLGAQAEHTSSSANIMLIIDTSISMVIRDYQLDGKRVDRMTMTQALLDRFSSRFSGQRIGIVIFGDPPQVLLKPSKDKNLVRHLIHRLKPSIAGRMAALGDAVAIAAEYIKSDETQTETVLVLFSDAVSPSGKLSPIEGAKRVAEANMVLHTIAIGSTDTAQNNLSASHLGELIYDAADVKLLQQMASITGGESFRGDDVASIDNALNKIEQRHKILTGPNLSRKQQVLYYWPLLIALFLLGFRELLTQSRTMSSTS